MTSLFNKEQQEHMRDLVAIPREKRCNCGWYLISECPHCVTNVPAYLDLVTNVSTGEVKGDTNLEDNKVCDFIEDFLKNEIKTGLGHDNAGPYIKDVYKILVRRDVDGSYSIESNTGNKDLTAGLLLLVHDGFKEKDREGFK